MKKIGCSQLSSCKCEFSITHEGIVSYCGLSQPGNDIRSQILHLTASTHDNRCFPIHISSGSGAHAEGSLAMYIVTTVSPA